MSSLYVVGLGITPHEDITLHALSVLGAVDCVLVFADDDAVQTITSLVPSQPVESILGLFYNGDMTTENYNRIIERVVLKMAACDSMAVCVEGDPVVGVSWVRWLIKELGDTWHIELVSGVSSLTVMGNALGKDLLEKGTVILDVNRLLLFEYTLDSSLDLYIYDICSTGTRRTHFSEPQKSNALHLLRDCLLRFYDLQHPVALCRVGYKAPFVRWCKLGNLCDFLEDIDFGSTLFVPGRVPDRYSRSFLDLLLKD